MTPRQIANDVAEMAANRIGAVIRDRMNWHLEHPFVAYKFHQTMTTALPRWRWLARRFHKAQARRSRAMWQAGSDAAKCHLAEAVMKVNEASA